MLGEKMYYSFLRCGQSNQDTWRKIVQSQRFLKAKDVCDEVCTETGILVPRALRFSWSRGLDWG